MQIILPCADNKNLVVDSRVESRHWCVDRLHACPRRHESLELVNLLTCNMRRPILSKVGKTFSPLIPSSTKLKPAMPVANRQQFSTSSCSRMMKSSWKACRVQLDSKTQSDCLWSERVNFKFIFCCKVHCILSSHGSIGSFPPEYVTTR